MSENFSKLSSISFFGRPYAELLQCFGLEESQLRGRSVLECPSGPSSFVAEASRRGIRAIGVDPLFYRSPTAIEDLARADFRVMFERVRASPERFVRRTYASIDEAERTRRLGMERFIADYASGWAAGRYRQGSLPSLDFEDEAFDLVLCGHLFFLYPDSLSEGFHREGLRELCRVARGEARVHPVVDGVGRRAKQLPELVELADGLGFDASVEEVEHEFFRGTNATLVLRRRSKRPAPVA